MRRRFYMISENDMMSKYEGRYFSIEYQPQYFLFNVHLSNFFICSYPIIPELELFYAVTEKDSYQLYDSESNGNLIEWTCPKEIYIDKFNSVDDRTSTGDTPAIYVDTYNEDVKNNKVAYVDTKNENNKTIFAEGFGYGIQPEEFKYKVYYVFKERNTSLDTSPMFMTANAYNDLYIVAGNWSRYRDCLLTADLSHLNTSIYTGSENWYDLAAYND